MRSTSVSVFTPLDKFGLLLRCTIESEPNRQDRVTQFEQQLVWGTVQRSTEQKVKA